MSESPNEHSKTPAGKTNRYYVLVFHFVLAIAVVVEADGSAGGTAVWGSEFLDVERRQLQEAFLLSK